MRAGGAGPTRPGQRPKHAELTPVFVDDSGRRLTRLRATTWSSWGLLIGFVAIFAFAFLGSLGDAGHWAISIARTSAAAAGVSSAQATLPAVQKSAPPAGASAATTAPLPTTLSSSSTTTTTPTTLLTPTPVIPQPTTPTTLPATPVPTPTPTESTPSPTAKPIHGSASNAPGQTNRPTAHP